MIEQWTHFLEEVGSSPIPGNTFSIYLNEELNQVENKNKNKNKNKNSSNSLVFGRWPQTKSSDQVDRLGANLSLLQNFLPINVLTKFPLMLGFRNVLGSY